MILDIYEQVTGSCRPSLLAQNEFASLDALFGQYDRRSEPTLLIVEPDDLVEVLTWIGPDDDVCLTTDPESLVDYRLQCLGLPDNSRFDALTGLLNRASFEQALQQAADYEPLDTCSLMLCDVDQFKRFNDSHGHQIGDEVLAVVSEILREACAESDLAARFGGEAFAILSDRDQESIVRLAERLRLAVEKRFADDLSVTISIGLATTEEATTVPDLMKQSEEAIFEAKASGRNCVVHYMSMQASYEGLGQDTGIASLENRARILSERVTNFITLRSRKLVNQFRKEADTDALTQFYNRGYLDRRLAREVENSQVPMCIAFADLDHFGSINKSQGWPTGDKVLREVGELIRAQLRDSDWVGRYGGEEFCIVMQNTKLSEALPVLERLRKAVESHEFLSTENEAIVMTLSIGAVESTASEGHEQLLERASQKALGAKSRGRNQVLA